MIEKKMFKLGCLLSTCVVAWLMVCVLVSLSQERNFIKVYKGLELGSLIDALCQDKRAEVINLKIPERFWLGGEENHLPKGCRRPSRAYWSDSESVEVLVPIKDKVPFPGYTVRIIFIYTSKGNQTEIEISRFFLTI